MHCAGDGKLDPNTFISIEKRANGGLAGSATWATRINGGAAGDQATKRPSDKSQVTSSSLGRQASEVESQEGKDVTHTV